MSRNLDSLIYALRGGDPDMHRSDAAQALGKLGDARAVQPLITALQRDKNSVVRGFAAEALGKIGDKLAVEPLIFALRDESGSVPIFAAQALGRIGDTRAVEPLLPLLDSYYIDTRSTVAEALGKIGDVRAVELLIRALRIRDGQESEIRWSATEALVRIGRPAVNSLISTLRVAGTEMRRQVVEILGKIGDMREVEPLVAALLDEDMKVRELAAQALGEIGDENILPVLERVLQDNINYESRYYLVRAVQSAITKITSRSK